MRFRLGYVTDSARQLQCFYQLGREPGFPIADYLQANDGRFLVYSDDDLQPGIAADRPAREGKSGLRVRIPQFVRQPGRIGVYGLS